MAQKKVKNLKVGDVLMSNTGLTKIKEIRETHAGRYMVTCDRYCFEAHGNFVTEVYNAKKRV